MSSPGSDGASIAATARAAAVLQSWLQGRLTGEHRAWLDERMVALLAANSQRDLYITLGLIPRVIGRPDLAPTPDELAEADAVRAGWDPTEWTIETAARALVLCRLAERDPDRFGELYADLCRNADLSESLTYYRAIAVLPASPALDERIGEGLRTNMQAVFESIAHRNPWPRERFDENRWNHMVLKALFIGSSLAPIQGLDERSNADLARILSDYAHERWAAGRPVTPELWRCVGPFAEGNLFDDLDRVLGTGSAAERDAALLALSTSPDPRAAVTLAAHPEAAARIAAGSLAWSSPRTTSLQSPPPGAAP